MRLTEPCLSRRAKIERGEASRETSQGVGSNDKRTLNDETAVSKVVCKSAVLRKVQREKGDAARGERRG